MGRDSVATVSQELEDSPGHGAGHELGRVFLVYKVAYTAATMSSSQAGLGQADDQAFFTSSSAS